MFENCPPLFFFLEGVASEKKIRHATNFLWRLLEGEEEEKNEKKKRKKEIQTERNSSFIV